jgi:hypothetical protein
MFIFIGKRVIVQPGNGGGVPQLTVFNVGGQDLDGSGCRDLKVPICS